ncbi:uncharacterized protein LOC130521192 isoform X2 [Takifugu flavidus]|uniref:uncharacterized protein LOC130521192 isoform X2 n=1 Tax=Takifugu flavidus TaxID=433684 RepID=UPI0025440378|nr:uncharacterized protein LOC130521192 isoform X2 [Takifugu flavidus]
MLTGACPEPLIRIVDGGPDWALLECEVKGAHTRPAVQVQNSSGRVLPAQETKSEERDGLFYVTVRANVSSSGNYSCVVTQEEFCHQINSTTFVSIGSTTGRDAAIGALVMLVVLVAIAAVVFYFKFKAVKGELAAASNQSTAVACTPAPEELHHLKNRHLGLIDGSDCPPQVLLVTDVFERSAAAGADVAVIIPENIPISYSQLSATDGLHPPGPELLLKMSPTSPHV